MICKLPFLKQFDAKTSAEQGRSMVEILGVLAVIGVLSAGGIYGYSFAMDKYRANDTLSELNVLAHTHGMQISQMIERENLPSDGEVLSDENARTRFGFEYEVTVYNDHFEIDVFDVPQPICNDLRQTAWSLPYDIQSENVTVEGCETVTYFFSNDIFSPDNLPQNDNNPDNNGDNGNNDDGVICDTGYYETAGECLPVPVITATSPQDFDEELVIGTTYSHQIQATISSNEQLTYTLSNAPATMSINNNGLLTFKPSSDDNSSGVVTVQITAPHAQSVSVQVGYEIALESLGDCTNVTMCDIQRDGMTVSIIKGGLQECGPNQFCAYTGTFSPTTVNGCSMGAFRGPVGGQCRPVSRMTQASEGLTAGSLGIGAVSRCYGSGGRLPFKSELVAQGLSPSDYWYVSGNDFKIDSDRHLSQHSSPIEILFNLCMPFDMTAEEMLQNLGTRNIIKCIYDD